MDIRMRGRLQPASDAGIFRPSASTPREAFKEVLGKIDFTHAEPVIEWTDKEQIASLDLDYHKEKPLRRAMERAAERMTRGADYVWITHGGGLRCIFFAADPLTAEERAAIFAYLFVSEIVPGRLDGIVPSGIEIKHETRHPRYPRGDDTCGEIHEGYRPDAVEKTAAELLGTARSVEDDAVDEWLSQHGFERGKRYPHDRCPIDPSSGEHREPVWIGDEGIGCHKCKATGPRGFVPFFELLDNNGFSDRVTRTVKPLRRAAKGFCHWSHAERIVAYETGLTGNLAKLVYRSLLKLAHVRKEKGAAHVAGTMQLIDKVFFPDVPLVRGKGYWVHASDLSTPCGNAGLVDMLAALPASQFVQVKDATRDDGFKLAVCRAKLGKLQSNLDLAEDGYPSFLPIRGMDYGWRDPLAPVDESTVYAVVEAKPPFGKSRRTGLTVEQAEREILRRFPGVNLDLLRLLIACKGLAQGNLPEPIRIALTGQSGAAKTASVLLAAELCCEQVGALHMSKNHDTFMQAVATNATAGTFVFIDEFAKSGLSSQEYQERLIFSRNTTYRELYRGNCRLPRMPVLVLADTMLPDVFRTNDQLARRVVHIDLGAGANRTSEDWKKTCRTGNIEGWRAYQLSDPSNHEVADVFTSNVIDRFRGCRTFDDVANALGFSVISKAGDIDGIDRDRSKLALFEAVCNAPATTDRSFKGRGWRTFHLDHESPLRSAFVDALGSATTDDWQEVTGTQWGNVIGVPGVEVNVRSRRRTIGIRFRDGPERMASTRFNGEIVGKPEAPPSEAMPLMPTIPDFSPVSSA